MIRATGSISMAPAGGLLGPSAGIAERELGKLLARVEHDDQIKALVLRIDSPGGSALASDLLWHALMRVRAKKPVVVSVGEMAASGGYYLASTGSVIFAERTSIVGSIGVVGGKIGFGKALAQIGVHAETFPAKKGDAKAAARAAYESPFVAWDDDTRARVKDSMVGIYDLFLDRVVEGRDGKITRAQLETSAEGRIFSGREGHARGLVDELGGLGDALARARDLAHLPADAPVMTLGHKASLFDALLGAGGDGPDEKTAAVAAAAKGPSLIDLAAEVSPDLAGFASSLAPLARGEHTLTAVPFAIVVK
jgi:protease-4